MSKAAWIDDWQPLIAAVGRELDGQSVSYGPDRVEPGHIRRYLEPLEFDCVLYQDADTARQLGWPDLVAPYTSTWSFVFQPSWTPGSGPTFNSPDRNAQPRSSAEQREAIELAPPTSHIFGTNAHYQFFRPPIVGDRIGLTGRRLVACEPKETSVGRGAFVTVERSAVDEDGEVLCTLQMQMYLYNPREDEGIAG